MQASACDPKASLISTTSRSPTARPARASALRVAGIGPMPMIAGSTPTVANERMRASGCSPCACAKASLVTSTAAAPSVSGEDVPAVTTPSGRNAGRSAANASSEVVGRMQPSSDTTLPSSVTMGTISSRSRPCARACAALRCESTASASWSARLTFQRCATFSAVSPIEM